MTFKLKWDTWLEQWMKNQEGLAMLNFDADSKKHAIKIASILLKIFKGCEIYWRRSSSGRGFHFVVAINKRPVYVPKEIALALRQYCYDCFGRLSVDKIRLKQGRQISILFSWKNGKRAGEWERLNRVKDIREVKMWT